jgi:3-oxosteroid 1-dehydrogenase
MTTAADLDCDVVVVGTGASGLAAALAASVGGAKVVVLEKSHVLGGTTAMSAAGTWVPSNHHMLAAGIEDSPAETLEYLRAMAPPGWQASEDELWQALAEESPHMLRFVEDKTPLRFELVNHPDFYVEAPGGRLTGRMVSPKLISRFVLGRWWNRVRKSVKPQYFTYKEMIGGVLKDPWRSIWKLGPSLAYRFVTGQVGMGNALTVGMTRGCLDQGCCILLDADVKRLLVDGDDPRTSAVIGVEAVIAGKKQTIRVAKGVVLATGGFDWNADLMKRYFPGTEIIGSPRTNTGDGQTMAASVGALLERMDQANIAPVTFTTYEGERHAQPLYESYAPHCILVNRQGHRFVSEGSPALGVAIDERDASGRPRHLPVWRIFDARHAAKNALSMYFGGKDPTWFRKAATIEALAPQIGLDPQTLRATVERFNGWSKTGRDEDFHRGETAWEKYYTGDRALGTVEEAPFYAAPFLYGSLGTKGGARTNRYGQVLRPDHSIIAGLYCAGLAMAAPIGTKAVGAGTTIGPCLTFGYIAGKAIARQNV